MDDNIDFKTFFFNDEELEVFYSHYRECAKIFGCYYMGYIYEDLNSKSRIGFTTNPDLQKQYIGNRLINHCHLWKEVINYFERSNAPNFILQWPMIKPTTSIQKDIILYREELGIGQDGISFCSNSKNAREYLYFAPEKNETRFLKHVSINLKLIKSIGHTFRNLSSNTQSIK